MINYHELRKQYRHTGHKTPFTSVLIWFVAILLFVLGISSVFGAQEPISLKHSVNVNVLADAIYIAEGGKNTKHPYGILAKYKVTTPRQACINTINSALKRWRTQGLKGDYRMFIAFLGSSYCPVGASNDPTGLNKHWVVNVIKIYDAKIK